MKEGKDNIKDLFSDKLAGYEGNVRPELWANISSQLGVATNVAASTGLSIVAKSIIGFTIAASVVIIGVVVFQNSEIEDKSTTNENQKNEIQTTENITDSSVSENSVVTEKEDKFVENVHIKENKVINVEQKDQIIINDPVETNITETKVTESPKVLENKVNEDKMADKINVDPIETIKKPLETQKAIPNEEIITDNSSENVLKELPNIFTPNGDRINDYLSISSEGLTDFSIVVIDQNNTIVYRSNDPNFSWDGIGFSGELVPSGMYIYYITARDSNNKLITRHSLLEIKR